MDDAYHLEVQVRRTTVSLLREAHLRRDGTAEVKRISYEIVGGTEPDVPATLDGYVVAVLMHVMGVGAPLIVHGRMSRTALYNIEDLQSFWTLWRPDCYRRIEIRPDEVIDLERCKPGRRAIAAFSGGVDSTFTALRHKEKLARAGSYNLDTVLMVHGFDVTLANAEHFKRLVQRTTPFLQHLGLQLKIIRTNSKELRLQAWEDSFSSELAACLHQFSHEFEFGLVASSEPYNDLYLPWGSNPITDGLLSGDTLAIVHDGAGFSRTDKVAALRRYPIAVASLKVCWEGSEQDRNCGACEKCVRTRLNFLAAGEQNPSCFDTPLDLRAIGRIPLRNHAHFVELRQIAEYAKRHGVGGEWLQRLRARIKTYERKARMKALRQQIVDGLDTVAIKEPVKSGLRALGLLR